MANIPCNTLTAEGKPDGKSTLQIGRRTYRGDRGAKGSHFRNADKQDLASEESSTSSKPDVWPMEEPEAKPAGSSPEDPSFLQGPEPDPDRPEDPSFLQDPEPEPDRPEDPADARTEEPATSEDPEDLPKNKGSKKKGSWLKRNIGTIIVVVILVVGIGLLSYPTFADWWNSNRATRVVTDYEEAVDSATTEEKTRLWNEAVEWNEEMASSASTLRTLSDEERARYNNLLKVSGTDAMSYVEIPTIRCTLPIYHGTDDEALMTGIGHIESSSLPVGGESTHCVISGHRGLPSAKLFTRLDELQEGDTFMLHTLGTTLTYEVDQILIVEPDEVGSLAIVEGQDLCTLVTCTPYGVNTHRLLVRGHRIPNQGDLAVTADALQIDRLIVAIFVAVPVLIIMFTTMAALSRRRSRRENAFHEVRSVYAENGTPPKAVHSRKRGGNSPPPA